MQPSIAQRLALSQMAALGIGTYTAFASLFWVLPVSASRLYLLSFLLFYLGLVGLLVTDLAAILSLTVHWSARRLGSGKAHYWLSLTKGLLLIGLSAVSLMTIATTVRPQFQRQMLFGMQVQAHSVSFSGATPDDMDERLQSALLPGQRIDRVELSGIGGSVEAARRAAALLKAHGAIRAVAVGDCASACATLFEEFPQREMAPNGRLGFHAYWGGPFNSAAEAQQREIDHLAARGVDADYAHSLFASPVLTWPSLQAMREHHLVTGCWSPTSAAPADCNSSSAPY